MSKRLNMIIDSERRQDWKLKYYHPIAKKQCNILLFGPPESGKSSFVQTLLSDRNNLQVFENIHQYDQTFQNVRYKIIPFSKEVRILDMDYVETDSVANVTVEVFDLLLKGFVEDKQHNLHNDEENWNLLQREDRVIDAVVFVFTFDDPSGDICDIFLKHRKFYHKAKNQKIPVFIILTKIDLFFQSRFSFRNDKKNLLIENDEQSPEAWIYNTKSWRKAILHFVKYNIDDQKADIFPIINHKKDVQCAGPLIIFTLAEEFVKTMVMRIEKISKKYCEGCNLKYYHPSGRRCNILLFGPPGHGKSSLVQTLLSDRNNVEIYDDVNRGSYFGTQTKQYNFVEFNKNVRICDMWGFFSMSNGTTHSHSTVTTDQFDCILRGCVKHKHKPSRDEIMNKKEKEDDRAIKAVVFTFSAAIKDIPRIIVQCRKFYKESKKRGIPVYIVITNIDLLFKSRNDLEKANLLLGDEHFAYWDSKWIINSWVWNSMVKYIRCNIDDPNADVFPIINYGEDILDHSKTNPLISILAEQFVEKLVLKIEKGNIIHKWCKSVFTEVFFYKKEDVILRVRDEIEKVLFLSNCEEDIFRSVFEIIFLKDDSKIVLPKLVFML